MAYTDVKVNGETSYRQERINVFAPGVADWIYYKRDFIEKKYAYHVLDKTTAEAGAATEATNPLKTATAKNTGKGNWWVIEVNETNNPAWVLVV